MDIGASTGGFTECLIKNGARLVFAVDVGHSQLSESLKNSTKITNLEKVNARYLTKKRMKNILEEKGYSKEIIDFSENINFAVIDVSFISILKIIPALLNLILPESQIVALIKPQFEAGKGIAEKGVIKDKKVIDKIIQRIRKDIESMGLKIKGITPSPVLGAKGNQEYLV
jgi:23S rRNA (cytidine1920-2'-O)/16S rRNA (cytidine1409-2'-O)-methyltransferase